ncbi:hypothetical protein C4K06_2182 [Pseudomonas chlororaphis subsp. aureofaciens]|nr:hypothetical protein C4K06_2182 [Pseudomonas chlororaphis subsp. aureofaciens]
MTQTSPRSLLAARIGLTLALGLLDAGREKYAP